MTQTLLRCIRWAVQGKLPALLIYAVLIWAGHLLPWPYNAWFMASATLGFLTFCCCPPRDAYLANGAFVGVVAACCVVHLAFFAAFLTPIARSEPTPEWLQLTRLGQLLAVASVVGALIGGAWVRYLNRHIDDGRKKRTASSAEDRSRSEDNPS